MALESTQPLTEMSIRSISWGVRLTTYHHLVPLSRNLETLTSWNPLGLSRPVRGLILLHVIMAGLAASTAVTPQACTTAILPMEQYRTENKKVGKVSTSMKAIPNIAKNGQLLYG